VLLSYGDFKFYIGISSYNTMSQKINFKWTSLDRRKRGPVHHFDGIGDETLSISGEIYRSDDVEEPRDIYKTLRESASKGRPQVLVDQDGFFYGRWILEDIDIKSEEFAPDGRPRKCDFTLSLKRYGED
jgi:uncharacterized protein